MSSSFHLQSGADWDHASGLQCEGSCSPAPPDSLTLKCVCCCFNTLSLISGEKWQSWCIITTEQCGTWPYDSVSLKTLQNKMVSVINDHWIHRLEACIVLLVSELQRPLTRTMQLLRRRSLQALSWQRQFTAWRRMWTAQLILKIMPCLRPGTSQKAVMLM